MSLPKIEKIRELSDAEISTEILAIKRELFELRLKKATRQPFKPSDFGFAKHRLSQLLTIENQRKQAVNGGQN
ncbi:ribosomal protein L29 [Synechococcus sp. PCC 7502]|uniref:50S ribosomal protein L29 n=1 Tax=Synechococcus sp. PCC 7502 TaxID=1173263 RepID=UPI00029F8AF9|nr:50S ribosomal protein L29 [Synechococcus sp. PCC 7502]AFY72907.1 ribosomal protein L29 [Synechococcus sp. PCC 7502]